MKSKTLCLLAAAIVGTTAIVDHAEAAAVTWGAPVPIGDGSDVTNLGTTVAAQYADAGEGTGTVSVNGVSFTEGFTNYTGYDGNADRGYTPSSNSTYNQILSPFAYDGSNPGVLTVSGLTTGKSYSVQLWGLDNANYANRTQAYNDGIGDSSAVVNLNPPVSVTGTFIADASGTQIINVLGIAQGQHNLNAFAVTTGGATPEPGTLGLLGLGGIGMLARRRSSRRPVEISL